jgi:hypothetical protein
MRARAGLLKSCCIRFGIAAMLAATSPAFASGSLGALLACRKVAASGPRLACFDRESGALAAQSAAAQTAAPDSHAAPESRTTLNAHETFGLAPTQVAARAEAAAHAPKPLDSLTARVTSIARAADGREVFTLDNHQIWVQLVADGSWLDVRTGEQVRVSRGWLDSYRLSLPSHEGFKVKRVR